MNTKLGKPWIACDLDGTIAFQDRWAGIEHIGAPIPSMIQRIKAWLGAGHDVRIFTARASHPNPDQRAQAIRVIEGWCEQHIGRKLPVTATKDYDMVLLYDDRARQVAFNKGEIIGQWDAL